MVEWLETLGYGAESLEFESLLGPTCSGFPLHFEIGGTFGLIPKFFVPSMYSSI